MNSQRFFTGLGLVSVSLAAHGAVFMTLNQAAFDTQIRLANEQRTILSQRNERLEFQFIEAPPKKAARKPLHTNKISSHDALNQDMLKDKSKADVLPFTARQSLGDQLAQLRGSSFQKASSKMEPSPAPHNAKAESDKQTEEAKSGVRHSERALAGEESPREMRSFASGAFLRKQEAGAQDDVKKDGLNRAKADEKPEVRGTGGPDKITTQEMGRIKSPGARLFGQTSFEATGSGMGEYMKQLKEKIWLAWFPYLAFQYPQDFRGADVVLSFTLDPQG